MKWSVVSNRIDTLSQQSLLLISNFLYFHIVLLRPCSRLHTFMFPSVGFLCIISHYIMFLVIIHFFKYHSNSNSIFLLLLNIIAALQGVFKLLSNWFLTNDMLHKKHVKNAQQSLKCFCIMLKQKYCQIEKIFLWISAIILQYSVIVEW